MISKKFSLMALIAIVAVASTAYGISEVQPQITRNAIAQFVDFTFEEQVERHSVVVVGEIVDVQIKLLQDNVMGTDENGNKYVYEENTRPTAKVTVQIEETLKDDAGLAAGKTITFYDKYVEGEIGISGGEKVAYKSIYATNYQVGDRGLFMIDNDRGLWVMGYTSYFPIIDGKSTITTELDKLSDNEPINLESAKNTARDIANSLN